MFVCSIAFFIFYSVQNIAFSIFFDGQNKSSDTCLRKNDSEPRGYGPSLFDAVMIDDDALLRCLFRRFPLMRKKASELTADEREVLSPAALMTNHFYT